LETINNLYCMEKGKEKMVKEAHKGVLDWGAADNI
jgi:hypothetical protein